jgi:isoleucyl-tRNA synthetase
VDEHLDNYRITEGARILADFIDELSNWYVRRSRERFWAKGMEQDKINAYMTLYTSLVTLAKVSAPYIPFMTEDIYRNLVLNVDKTAPESIHLCLYPTYNEAYIDKELEKNMEELLEIVVLGRSCRNAANIKNRQPIGNMYVKADFTYTNDAGNTEKGLPAFFTEIIEEELNVKKITFTDDVRNFTSYSFKPQLKTLGPKFGKHIGQIKQILSEVDGNKAMDEINATGGLKVTLEGKEAFLEKEDLLIETAQMEGFVSDSYGGVTVVLDTKLTPELIEEGFVREIISKIQTMRKDAGFEVMDHIVISQAGNDKIKAIIENNAEEIKSEVMADNIILDSAKGFTKDWNLNGEDVTLGVEKVQ